MDNNTIKKTCVRHGVLTPEQIYVYNRKDKNGISKAVLFCRRCKIDVTLAWQKKNPQKIREYGVKNKVKNKARQVEKKYYLSQTKNLTDGYVKNVLHCIYDIPCRNIPLEAIEIKREALKLFRQKLDNYHLVSQLDKLFENLKRN